MSFPTPRDRALAASAEQIAKLADNLGHWATNFAPQRREPASAAVSAADESLLRRLCREAANLCHSARHPVAAAIYGPSQVGKSLFVGRVLAAADENCSPLGRDEHHGEPGYFTKLSFEVDLNPQSGSNEATALVTRFTTSDRLPTDLPAEFPVLARPMNRAELLRVLARGFAVECASNDCWDTAALERVVNELSRRYPAARTDESWSSDLLSAYAYVQSCDPRRYPAEEQSLAALLAAQPLTSEGCVALAAALFWDSWRSLTGLFLRIDEFLRSTSGGGSEPGLLVPWAGVRFLLDSKRAVFHERRASCCFTRVDWSDFQLIRRGTWPVLDYRPGAGAYREPLETIQAAMLELVVPVLPHRLHDDWRQVLEQNDILDIPGLRAGRQGAAHGKRTSADTLDEQLEILKRGKVAYLFEHYTEQFQIQTLLLLARGGNLEVTAQLRDHVDRWGQMRYGRDRWPVQVPPERPALFIGLTGIDEEFRSRHEFAEPMLYDARITQLTDALGPVATQFGGTNRPFTNIFPLRYPGTWDANGPQQQAEGTEKWNRAAQAFLASAQVRRFVADAGSKWEAAMCDRDGGLSLVSAGWRAVTTSEMKQSQLSERLAGTREQLLELARRWAVSEDVNCDREKRLACARLVLDWLASDRRLVYERFGALRHSLSIHEGDQYRLSDFAGTADDVALGRDEPCAERFQGLLRDFLSEWSERQTPERWDRYTQSRRSAGNWLPVEEISRLAHYLRDYFCSARIFARLEAKLWQVMNLRLRDESARREGRRRYVRLILNDAILSPGLEPTRPVTLNDASVANGDGFGLMTPVMHRWQAMLPEVLAASAGEAFSPPAGNQELLQLLQLYSST
jgi:hypothetical protein